MTQCNPVPARPIIDACLREGFSAAGVCVAQAAGRPEAFGAWLEDGKHGDMHFMESHQAIRLDVRTLIDGARSVIVVADRYSGATQEDELASSPRLGRIARYARGRDYHAHMKKRLHRVADALAEAFPDHAFQACVDTAPVLERDVAQQSGLGAIGKHTLLIQPGVGSWLLLGELVTTLAIEPTSGQAPGTGQIMDPCGTCTRCLEACPTQAITPFSVDATRCVSYLTIEHRRVIDVRLHAGIGDWLFGCDVCQEVCPHNQPTTLTRQAPSSEAYAPREAGRLAGGAAFDVLAVMNWSEADRRHAFATSAMKRAKLDMIRRNAIIVATNRLLVQGDPSMRAAIERIAADDNEPPLVRETARQSLLRLAC